MKIQVKKNTGSKKGASNANHQSSERPRKFLNQIWQPNPRQQETVTEFRFLRHTWIVPCVKSAIPKIAALFQQLTTIGLHGRDARAYIDSSVQPLNRE